MLVVRRKIVQLDSVQRFYFKKQQAKSFHKVILELQTY